MDTDTIQIYKEPEELREFYRRRTSEWRVWEDIQNGENPYPDSIIEELKAALNRQLLFECFGSPRTMSSIEMLHAACMSASKKIDSFITSEDPDWTSVEVNDYDLVMGSLYYHRMLNLGYNLMGKYGELMQLPGAKLNKSEMHHLENLRTDMFSCVYKVMDFAQYSLIPSYTHILIDSLILSRKNELETQYKNLEFWVERCGSGCSETIKELWSKFYQIDTEALNLAAKGKLSISNDCRFDYIGARFGYSKEDLDENSELMGFIEKASTPRRLFSISESPIFDEAEFVLNGKNLDIFFEIVDRRNAIICGMNPELRKKYDKQGTCGNFESSANENDSELKTLQIENYKSMKEGMTINFNGTIINNGGTVNGDINNPVYNMAGQLAEEKRKMAVQCMEAHIKEAIQKGVSYKLILMPYVAALRISLVPYINQEEFNKKFGIKIPQSSYSEHVPKDIINSKIPETDTEAFSNEYKSIMS